MTSIAGAVLAGGQSSRMKRDKAHLPLQGTTLLHKQLALLEAVGIEQHYISGKNADGIADYYAHRGPLGGLHALLSQCQHDYLLVLAIDMPLLQPAELHRLMEYGLSHAHPAPCHYTDHMLPLFLPVQPSMREWLATQLQHATARHCSMRRFCSQFNAQAISCDHPEHLFNANTPAQWQHCLATITQ